ncbi:plastocyanin/azurin family copper-binding protein [Paenibacillus hodogayensis]|uniref:Plastocyanin/azurin family copper-binding protein n=1 Tax=Paenibacillus hodogayensis TaxID=279208 RepID=A0ABV5VVB7_9BACL
MNKFGRKLIALALGAALLLPAALASAETAPGQAGGAANVKTDAQTAEQLGLLAGDGNGVNADYLAKGSMRIQAAIVSLRLQGKLDEATAFTGKSNFDDASLVSAGNQAIMAYLHSHPEYGWTGEGANRFNPLAPISSQQLYKVLLEAAGYKSDSDFAYKDTETFAAGKGLTGIAGVSTLTNAHIATALVESLSAKLPGGGVLLDKLKQSGSVPAASVLPAGERIGLRADAALGTVLTDKEGQTLYVFSNDAQNLDACQGACIANWPLLDSEQLQIPATLDAADFSKTTHANGTQQWMYKGWPLYTFVKDKAAGSALGEGVNGVWFAAKPDYRVMIGSSPELGRYLTDGYGRTLYYFAKDMPQMSACEGMCLTNWPAYGSVSGSLPSTLNAADFGFITRADGSSQATYKGYPLYYFVKDAKHGDATGQNVNQVWFVVDTATFGVAPAEQPATEANGQLPAAPAAPADEAKTYRIDIKQFSFGSGPLTVEAGSSIVFTNYDDMKHNAVATGGSFSTPLLAKGESYTITLNEPGTYDYYCEPHKAFMTGQIVVK